jgi:glycosyltransferase involved in cell wall biosynthesis
MDAQLETPRLSECRILVSVIVPTLNRSSLLRDLLESLIAQTYDPHSFEIIVVDNCSTDSTPDVVRALQAVSACSLVYHRLPKDCGPAHARNQGARLARGAILAFTDSDCRADSRWLSKGTNAFRDGVAFVTGSILHKPGQRVRLFSGAYDQVRHEHPTYPTANAFYRRQLFLDMGGFDETLCFHTFLDNKPIECADTDLPWRIKESGSWTNVFVPDLVIYHEVPVRTMWKWLLDPYRLFVLAVLVKRHPQLRGLLLHGRLFFQVENGLFYLATLGIILGVLVHIAYLLLALPYALRVVYVLRNNLTIRRFPKLLLQVPLLAARQGVQCAALIYGSVRFGSVVL